MLAAVGLTAQDVARRVTEWASALPGAGSRGGGPASRRLDARELEGFGSDFGPGEQAR